MTVKTQYDAMCKEFFPLFKSLAATEVYSITLGGSHGRELSDQNSDYDFRIYYEKPSDQIMQKLAFDEITALCEKWRAKGVKVDGIFPRTYKEVDDQIDLWLTGNGKLIPYVWTIWGYSILTDIYNQKIIYDPYGKATQWKERLSVYPEPLKKSILSQYASSLEYWRNDYHYLNKIKRNDIDEEFLKDISKKDCIFPDIDYMIYY